VQPGDEVAPPDYVGVGAMKSGTTWWAGLITAHPTVSPPLRKELHFFDPFCHRPFTDADRETYWSFFARRPGTVSGEWTPQYSVDFWTAPLLRRAAPDAKLLITLRDPIDRYRSGLTHVIQHGRSDFAAISRDHFRRGLYHAQLTWILQHFPRAQVLVLQFEQCVRDPVTELKRTYEFLGLDSASMPAHAAVAANVTKSKRFELTPDVTGSLRRLYRADAEALFGLFPELEPSLWRTTMGGDQS
jgi:hypothetical protein